MEAYCPWVTTVRPGICSLPGPGPGPLLRRGGGLGPSWSPKPPRPSPRSRWGWPTGCSPPCSPPGTDLVVPAGGTPAFLAPLAGGHPRPARAGRTAGPAGHPHPRRVRRPPRAPRARPVRGRRRRLPPGGRGRSGSSGDLRQPAPTAAGCRRRDGRPARTGGRARVLGRGERRRRPGRPGPGRRPGAPGPGRRGDRPAPGGARAGPAGPLRHLERTGRASGHAPGRHRRARGRARSRRRPRRSCTPPPSRPSWSTPGASPCAVSARGLLTAAPGPAVGGGRPLAAVTGWAGPWPSDERWWSRSRRRGARLQVVTAPDGPPAAGERGRWWLEATYD